MPRGTHTCTRHNPLHTQSTQYPHNFCMQTTAQTVQMHNVLSATRLQRTVASSDYSRSSSHHNAASIAGRLGSRWRPRATEVIVRHDQRSRSGKWLVRNVGKLGAFLGAALVRLALVADSNSSCCSSTGQRHVRWSAAADGSRRSGDDREKIEKQPGLLNYGTQ